MITRSNMRREDHQRAGSAGLLTALLVVFVMVFTLLPGQGVHAAGSAAVSNKVADPATHDTWKGVVENTTQNIGRIWTDKTVSTGNMDFGSGATVQKSPSSDFLITLSAMSSTSNIDVKTQKPLDIVLVLDTSGSMGDDINTAVRVPVYGPDLDTGIEYYADIDGERRTVSWDEERGEWGYRGGFLNLRWYAVEPMVSPEDADSTHVQFYRFEGGGTESKMEALQRSVNGFIDAAVTENAGIESDRMKHRIGIVSYASDAADESDLTVCTEETGADMKRTVNSLRDNGATRADMGMANAEAMLQGAREDAKTIVIFFTDGVPTQSNTFNDGVANRAVGTSGTLKAGGTLVYSIGIFEGADPASTDIESSDETDMANCFMNAVSSNYPDATEYTVLGERTADKDFYKTATNAGELNAVFEEIFEELSASAGVPTEMASGEPADSDGYITITDRLGQYMEVKGFNSIVYAGKVFTDPVKSTEGLTDTYVFSGTNVGNSLYPDASLDKIIIKVTRSEALSEGDTVTVKIPAALLPLRSFHVDAAQGTGDRFTTTVKDVEPGRICYDIGLKEGTADKVAKPDAAMEAYIEDHRGTDGTLSFYANAHTKGSPVGNVVSSFVPSHTNQFYYVTSDALLFSDRELTVPLTDLGAGEGYYGELYFSTDSDLPQLEVTHVDLTDPRITDQHIKTNAEGQYYIPAGTLKYEFVNETKLDKTSNPTGTATTVIDPRWNVADVNRIDVFLGNNGRADVDIPGTLKFSKIATAEEGCTPPDRDFRFTLSLKTPEGVPDTGRYQAEFAYKDGSIESTCTMHDGYVFSMSQSKDLFLYGLPEGTVYTLTESDPGYGNRPLDPTATGTITGGRENTDSITNIYEPEGSLSGRDSLEVTKVIDGRDWMRGDTFSFTLEAGDSVTSDAIEAGLIILPSNAEELTIDAADAGGKASFGDIVFRTTGEFNFDISENNVTVPGLAKDSTVKSVNVQVTDEETGVLTCTASGDTDPVFTNVHTPEPVYVTLSGTKTLTGLDLGEGDFGFEVAPVGDAPAPDVLTARNAGDGSIRFAPIQFTEEGTYSYDITETLSDIPGVTSDSGTVRATVEITRDASTGELVKAVSYSKDSGNLSDTFTFTNAYRAEPTDTFTGFRVEKTVESTPGNSYEMKGGEFDFTLTPSPDNSDSDPVTEQITATNDADGSVVFGSGAVYTQPGVYVYTVRETSTDAPGMTYDPAIYTITVTVTDNKENAKLTASSVVTRDGQTAEPVFTNTYDPGSVSAVIGGNKTLTGKDIEAGQFTFELEGEGQSLTAVNTATGEFSFDAIEYTKPGIYEYKVRERNGGLRGYTYDDTVHDVTVTVTDSGGALSAAVTGGDSIEFINSYEALSTDSFTVRASKALTGRDLKAGEFTFVLKKGNMEIARAVNDAEGNVTITDPVTLNMPGVHQFTLSEAAGTVPGVAYSTKSYGVNVNVADVDGQLTVTSVEYWDNGQQVTDSVPVFTNTYEPEDVSLDISQNFTKTVSGRDWKAGEQYTFTMKNKAGTPAFERTATVDRPEAGNMEWFGFGTLTYTDAGVYEYTIVENAPEDADGMTYDRHISELAITVRDDTEQGKLTAHMSQRNSGFENVYEPVEGSLEGKTALEVTKELSGRSWKDGDSFGFVLEPYDDITKNAVEAGDISLPDNASGITIDSSDSDRKAHFGDIVFRDGGTFKFSIKENTGDDGNMTYDPVQRIVTVTAVDDLSGGYTCTPSYTGSMTFTNIHTADPAAVLIDDGQKILNGREMKEDDVFAFTIEGIDGAPEPAVTEVDCSGDGTISFPEISYDEAGIYEYDIKEKAGNAAGVTYDDSVVRATVKVTYDDEAGTLNAAVQYSRNGADPEDSFTFTNTYRAGPTDTVTGFEARKDVDASEGNSYIMKGGEFTFRLAPSSTNPATDPLREAIEKKNDADGNVVFSEGVKYTEEGTYIYNVTEKNTSLGGISYDAAVYTMTVTVTDRGGKLAASKSIEKNGREASSMVFTNSYDPEETSVIIGGEKRLEGKDAIEDGMFTFVLDGHRQETVTNTGAAFAFSEITYDRPGRYDYTVTEQAGNERGYTYDESTYDVQVDVRDEDGVLTAEVTGGEGIVFTNSYAPDPVTIAPVKARKDLEGRDLKAGEFTFTLTGPDGFSRTAKNDAGGDVDMGDLTFTEPGEYIYTLKEKPHGVAGVVYDSSVYTVKVTVSDSGGYLETTVDYFMGQEEVSSEDLLFTNSYEPGPASVTVGAVKVLEGRDMEKGEFTFEMADSSGSAVSTAVNGADGSIVFDEMTFDTEGEYVYTVYEVPGDDGDIVYDDTVYTITIDVADRQTGSYTAVIEGGDDMVFNNEFTGGAEDGPKTGDGSPLGPVLALMLAALTAGGIVYIRRYAR